jgi:1,4-alpha-glucan branching enzyme
MGAVPQKKGVSFRVWAPHADELYVTGTFCDWLQWEYPLAHEEDGYWSTFVEEAAVCDHYKYLIINGDRKIWRSDPYARSVCPERHYESVIEGFDFDWGDDAYELPPWNELTVYELHVGTFSDGKGDRPGTFKRLCKKLPYLQELGVNAIELMPFSEFPTKTSWGYNPTFLFAVETDYGGPTELKNFIKAAHEREIGVIIDVIYNHFGTTQLDLWQFDGWSENDGGGIYIYNDWRAQTPWGDTRPDYGRPEVRQYLRDNAMMWLQEYRADGVRIDGTAWIRRVDVESDDPERELPDGWSLMQWINKDVMAMPENKIVVAEDHQDEPAITRPAEEGGAGFGAQWDGMFGDRVREAVKALSDEERSMAGVVEALQHSFNRDATDRIIYTESHDEVANGKARVPFEISPDDHSTWFARKRSTLAAALVFTAPGIPMIFQGQEFLEDDWFRDDVPLDWSKKDTFSGILHLYRDLFRLRRNLDQEVRGLCGQGLDVFHVNERDKLIAFDRWDEGGPADDVLVVANFANRKYDRYELAFPAPGKWKVRFNSDWSGYGEDFEDHLGYDPVAEESEEGEGSWTGDIGIGAYTALILSQDAQ